MRRSSLPATGPIRIDCRQMAPGAALRRVEDLLKRTRAGARLVRVVVDDPDAADLLASWARDGGARTEVDALPAEQWSILLYLLPAEFDGHPLLAWRPTARSLDATPDGLHVTL